MNFAHYGQRLVQMTFCVALLLGQSSFAVAGAAGFLSAPELRDVVLAQAAPGLNNPQRNCQTLRNCQYSRGGSFRGCVSSYSCRNCRYVISKCSVGASTGKCERQVCEWG